MSKLYVLILNFYAMIPKQESGATDWCKLECTTSEGTFKNTMCEYGIKKSTFGCHSIRDTNAPETIKEILHYHNWYRNQMAGGGNGWPSAANMRQMTWDDGLEAVALRWAQQCIAEHDKCRRTPKFYVVGQNYCVLANWKYYVDSTKECFEGWVEGISVASPKTRESFEGGNWARFTQVIWAESYKLGCAQIHFRQSGRGVSWKKTALVCNYGPGGNLMTQKIYEAGKACSECPKNSSCRPASTYPNLCALPEDPTGPQDIIDDNIYNKDVPKSGAGSVSLCKLVNLWSVLNEHLKSTGKRGVENTVESLILILMSLLLTAE